MNKYISDFNNFNESSQYDMLEDISYILVDLDINVMPDYEQALKLDMFVCNTSTSSELENIDVVNSRLKDIGYTIVSIHKSYDTEKYMLLIIKNDFLNKLKKNNIVFWEDIKWKKWHLASFHIETKETKQGIIDDICSVIDGKISPFDSDSIEIMFYEEDDVERFYDKVTAEFFIIKKQVELKKLVH